MTASRSSDLLKAKFGDLKINSAHYVLRAINMGL